MALLDSIFSFLGPILTSALASGASTGVNKLMSPSQGGGDPNSIRSGIQSGAFTREGLQSGAQVPGQPNQGPAETGAGTGMGSTAVGAGGSTNPSFGGGYTGGIDPRTMGGSAGQPAGPPSSGFTTMGFPKTDQDKLRQSLSGSGGFQGI